MAIPRALAPILLVFACCSGAPAPETGSGSAASDPSRPLPLPLPDVVARVNGQEIRIHQILPLAKTRLAKVSIADRDARKPEAVRMALDDYVSRELLLQEALARGISPDSRGVEWSYDQLRREHPDEAEWTRFLAEQGMDALSFKAELRVQHTVAALLAAEQERTPVREADARAAFDADPWSFGAPGSNEPPSFEAVRGEAEAAVRLARAPQLQAALVARLRARAKIELFL